MRGQIKEVLAGLNKATVIVTHDQLEALTMADRIAVMRDGLIEQCASPHEIFARPANLFVAGFIGTPQMNLIPAVLGGPAECGARQADADGPMRFGIGGESILLRADPAVGRLPLGTGVTLGIRPRGIELVGEPQSDSLSADVDLVEPMGAETLLHVVGPGRELRVVVDQHVNARMGERLHLRFKPGQTHVFASDERRVSA
ncbi:MAG: TOBE domain-containing protein [Geminicoccaceae bacterium]